MLISKIVALQPAFAAFWAAKGNPSAETGENNVGEVFACFSDFFRQRHGRMSEQEVRAIGALIASCETDEELRRAAYTGFLQNIADDPPDATLDPFLPPEAIDFLAYWRKPK